MISALELRKIAARSGARDVVKIEIDVILTHILQLFHESGVVENLAFKGGTMLRKMMFGPRGRLSTDLDFTLRSGCSPDDCSLMMAEALQSEYHGLRFSIARDKDWYETANGFSINPVASHDNNPSGIKIKIEVSTREEPILPVLALPQIPQEYFGVLPFSPADIPCLNFEEVVAEKIRAASQRSKVRDLHDLGEISKRDLDKTRIRSLAVLKLWSCGGFGLDFAALSKSIMDDGDYDEQDLKSLLRRDETPNIGRLKTQVVTWLRFLDDLTAEEKILANDIARARTDEAGTLRSSLQVAADQAVG